MTAAILLAAGSSARLGHPKQLVRLAGETLLDRAVRVAAEAGLAPIFVVLAIDLPADRPSLTPGNRVPWVRVENREASEGIASSIRAGIAAVTANSTTAAILLACDQPAVTPGHLRRLAAEPTRITASRYAGRTGIPAFFPASAFPQLATLRGDRGARDLLLNAHAIDLPLGELDIDTAADLELARTHFDAAPSPKR